MSSYSEESVAPVYEYTSYFESNGEIAGTTVVSNMINVATGLAVADPVVIAWQIDDVGTFPNKYVESLVERYSIEAPEFTPTGELTPESSTSQQALRLESA